jgi:hypothetical protein
MMVMMMMTMTMGRECILKIIWGGGVSGKRDGKRKRHQGMKRMEACCTYTYEESIINPPNTEKEGIGRGGK